MRGRSFPGRGAERKANRRETESMRDKEAHCMDSSERGTLSVTIFLLIVLFVKVLLGPNPSIPAVAADDRSNLH